MEDRELLELAAKAACLSGYIYECVNGPEFIIPGEEPIRWNPLRDDGDALRLAVKLGIAPIQDKKDNVCAAYWTDIHCCHVGYNSDPVSATRRAIVRAAAEIGKQMA